MEYRVGPEETGWKIREVLRRSMGVSYTAMKSAKWNGRITLNGGPARADERVTEGDTVTIDWAEDVPVYTLKPFDFPIRVPYADEHLMAVDKPAGILVHGDGTGARTLTDGVAALLGREGVPAAPQAVQRLDVDTTGVVLFSLAPEFQPALDALVASHDMRKRYLAVVEGSFDAGVRRLDAPLGRDRHDARRMRATWPWWRARLTRACAGWTRRSGATGTTRGACA